MRKLEFLLVLLFLASCGFSQEKSIEFKKSKSNGNETFVYFKVSNVNSITDIENLKKLFSNDSGIKNFQINNEGECKMVVSPEINAVYIRKKLLTIGNDFDLTSILINDKSTLKEMIIPLQKNRTDGMPDHYPIFINTGNPDFDNANYDYLKKDWIENYPVEYAKLRGITIDEVYTEQINSNHEPQFIDTGNPDVDKKRFNDAKIKWDEIQKKLINFNTK